MGEEKRRRSRVSAHFDAYVYVDGEKIPVITRNLSLKGALFAAEPRLALGRECSVVFRLSRDTKVRLKGTVVRSDEEGLAIDFDSMEAGDFFHLRNMVRYSAQDADKIDRELEVPAFDIPREGEQE